MTEVMTVNQTARFMIVACGVTAAILHFLNLTILRNLAIGICLFLVVCKLYNQQQFDAMDGMERVMERIYQKEL